MKETKILHKLQQKVINSKIFNQVIEIDYITDEEIELTDDSYNIAIATNLARRVSPQLVCHSARKIFIVFILQIQLSYGYFFDYKALT